MQNCYGLASESQGVCYPDEEIVQGGDVLDEMDDSHILLLLSTGDGGTAFKSGSAWIEAECPSISHVWNQMAKASKGFPCGKLDGQCRGWHRSSGEVKRDAGVGAILVDMNICPVFAHGD